MTQRSEDGFSALGLRAAFGGALMGLANLVPGISGGTMLLAAGIYPRFIDAIADVTTFRFKRRSIAILFVVAFAAGLAILFGAGAIKDLVLDARWVMYSIFIGLTLGGVPLVWKLIGEPEPWTWIGAAAGVAAMCMLALMQAQGIQESGHRDGFLFMFLAGAAGAGAMILPGVSGGYLLLLLGVYLPILSGIDALKAAISSRDIALMMDPLVDVVLPVGLGVAVGILVVSNVLRMLLIRFKATTLGVLLGLLVGALAGLWPYQVDVAPQPGAALKGQIVQLDEASKLVFSESGREVERKDFPVVYFTPSASQVGISIALLIAGFAVTALVARIGAEPDDRD